MSSYAFASLQEWPFSLPLHSENLTHPAPIRRFCAAAGWDQENLVATPDHDFDLQAWSSSYSSDSSISLEGELCLADSFINADIYEDKHSNSTHNTPSYHTQVPHSIAPALTGAAVDEGLELMQSLFSCAEAVGYRDTRLATSTLSRIWSLASPLSDAGRRVSFFFAVGLETRLSLLHAAGANGSLAKRPSTAVIHGSVSHRLLISNEEKLEGYCLLNQTTPYLAFAFTAANDAIYQSTLEKQFIHVIDIGMPHGLQWPSLIRALATRPEGPPKLFRLTGVASNQVPELEASMEIMIHESRSNFGMLVEFHAVIIPETEGSSSSLPSLLTHEKLGVREGEAVVVNSVMQLHKFAKESRGAIKSTLTAIKKLNPLIMTIVEQDANHNGPFFLGRFLEALHYYSAVFDSLEACLPRSRRRRMVIERCCFGAEIENVVAREGAERVERHERAEQWRRQLARAGFQGVGMACMSQVKMLLALYGCEGFSLASEKGSLVLGWKGRPLLWASAWKPNHLTFFSSSSSSSSII